MIATRLLETISGLSVPAPAMAGAAMLIPSAAPMTDKNTLRPIPMAAHTIGSTMYSHIPSFWFLVGREGQTGAFIKLAKPLNPVKPQSLHENDQSFDDHY